LVQLYLFTDRKLDRAVELALQATELEPIGWNFYLLGSTYQRLGELDAARKAIAQAIELEPNNPLFQQANKTLAGDE
jgi:Flp pilus assembly protein TadD